MFGAFVRYSLACVGAVLVGALLSRIVPYLYPLMGDKDGILYTAFHGVEEWGVTIMLLSCVFGLFVRANVERRYG